MEVVRAGAIATVQSEDELRTRYGRWAALARAGQQTPNLSSEEIELEVASRRVYADMEVEEFVDLDDGRRIIGAETLGLTSAPSGVRLGDDGIARPDPWSDQTAEDIEVGVMVLVARDGERGDGRWQRLLTAIREQGIRLTAADLDAAPFVIELSGSLRERLATPPRP